MNCEDYRQAIAADPSFDGGAGHLSECAACQAYRSEIQALDQTIGRALALDVPELHVPDLPVLSEFATSRSDNVIALPKRRWGSPTWSSLPRLAVAATVVVAVLLGVRFIGTDVEQQSLAAEIVAHLDFEPGALRVSNVAVTDERLGSVMSADVARLDHSAGLITYAQTCKINGRDVPHLVIQGERGPVTILLMPDEKVSEAQLLSGDNINGVLLPVGNGSIAIIGEREERLDQIKETVLKSVTWST